MWVDVDVFRKDDTVFVLDLHFVFKKSAYNIYYSIGDLSAP